MLFLLFVVSLSVAGGYHAGKSGWCTKSRNETVVDLQAQ